MPVPSVAFIKAPPVPQPDPPAPDPFPGRTAVTVEELIAELDAVAADMEDRESLREEFESLAGQHDLEPTDALFQDYVRVKLAFEATRDGGFWHLAWTITNEKPNSEKIWKQWAGDPNPRHEDSIAPTAWAECDELSALFAFVARRLGVDGIGLFWPTWNHVVAVWKVEGRGGKPVRVVVPTSQIFLGSDATLGTDGFDPWKQKKIYTYKRKDVKLSRELPGDLARFFIVQARLHAHKPAATLQLERNQRSSTLGGS